MQCLRYTFIDSLAYFSYILYIYNGPGETAGCKAFLSSNLSVAFKEIVHKLHFFFLNIAALSVF